MAGANLFPGTAANHGIGLALDDPSAMRSPASRWGVALQRLADLGLKQDLVQEAVGEPETAPVSAPEAESGQTARAGPEMVGKTRHKAAVAARWGELAGYLRPLLVVLWPPVWFVLYLVLWAWRGP